MPKSNIGAISHLKPSMTWKYLLTPPNILPNPHPIGTNKLILPNSLTYYATWNVKGVSTQVRKTLQKVLTGTFVGWLKEEIVAEVHTAKPKTLREAFGVACMRDKRLTRKKKQNKLKVHKMTSLPKASLPASTAMKPSSGTEAFVGRNETTMGKGLCFSCNRRFTPGHRCRSPQVFLREGGPAWQAEDNEEEQVCPTSNNEEHF